MLRKKLKWIKINLMQFSMIYWLVRFPDVQFLILIKVQTIDIINNFPITRADSKGNPGLYDIKTVFIQHA